MSFILLPCLWLWWLCGAAFALGYVCSLRPRTAQAAPNRRKPTRPRPAPKPATPHICPDCNGSHATIAHPVPAWLNRTPPPPWRSTRKPGGRPKRSDSHGRFCPNPLCLYGGIADAAIHALVADGRRHGIQIWQCQACGHHVVDRFGTFLYRRRKPLALIQAVLADLCHGSSIRRAAEVHAVSPQTVLAWLAAFGARAPALWHHLAAGRIAVDSVQLDELRTLVRRRDNHPSDQALAAGEFGTQWVWTAIDAATKLWLVVAVGPRTKSMACSVIHQLKALLADDCVPTFSSDGLMHYFYALTAHFGHWLPSPQGRSVWQVSSLLLYAQVVKRYARRQIAHVSRLMLLGSLCDLTARLTHAGSRGSINTSFVERLNLTLRSALAALRRRTPHIAKRKLRLLQRLSIAQLYYNLVRIHSSLRTTPAHRAGLTDRPWSWADLLQMRLPHDSECQLTKPSRRYRAQLM